MEDLPVLLTVFQIFILIDVAR